MIPTGWQIREGREMIGMSQADLAEAAGVGLAVVIRAELAAHIPMLTRKDSAAMANHASTRTRQLYNRRAENVTLDEVERIGI